MSAAVPDSDLPDSIVPDTDMPTAATAATAAPSAPYETAGRVAGLTTRALGAGTANTAGFIARSLLDRQGLQDDALNTGLRLGSKVRDWFNGDNSDGAAAPDVPQVHTPSVVGTVQNVADKVAPQFSDFVHPDRWQDAVNFLADRAGLAAPATPGERIYSKTVEALPGAALTPEAPIMGALSAAAGGATSQTVKEAGGSPLQQTLAGLAVGSVPSLGTAAAGLTRTVARGAGSDAAAAMQGRMADAAASGTTLTAGQAGGSRVVQALEKSSGNLWGGGSVAKNAERQTGQLESSVNDIVDNLNPKGAALTPTGAGEAINKGVSATKQSMRDAEKAAYDKVDQLVPSQSPVDVSGTLAKLETLATPTPGAEATTGALISPKVKAMRDNLQSDIAKNGGTSVPYSAATDLRTQLGNSIDWGFAPTNPVENAALKQVHGALKGDIDSGASAISPDAKQAVSDARSLYAQNQGRRDLLNGIIDKAGGPEAVYAAATNGAKQGATKISGVMSALDPENANVVRATVLHRMGRAIPSAASPEGEFNANTLLTNWNRMSPEAKDALFGASGAGSDLRKSLDSITNTVGTLRKAGHTLANPSGSAGAGAHAFELWKVLEAGGGVLAGAVHPKALAAVAAAIPANMVLSRALVNPRTARWIAATTKLPRHAIPNAINQLTKMGQVDPDARDLSAALQGQQGGAQ